MGKGKSWNYVFIPRPGKEKGWGTTVPKGKKKRKTTLVTCLSSVMYAKWTNRVWSKIRIWANGPPPILMFWQPQLLRGSWHHLYHQSKYNFFTSIPPTIQVLRTKDTLSLLASSLGLFYWLRGSLATQETPGQLFWPPGLWLPDLWTSGCWSPKLWLPYVCHPSPSHPCFAFLFEFSINKLCLHNSELTSL